jgi:hypothetical protein
MLNQNSLRSNNNNNNNNNNKKKKKKKKNDTSNNRGYWNHFKITQTTLEQHTMKARN